MDGLKFKLEIVEALSASPPANRSILTDNSVVIPLAKRSKRYNPPTIHVMAFILTNYKNLVEIFSKYGDVQFAKVTKGRTSSHSDHGYVKYKTEEEVKKAIEAGETEGILLNGHQLHVGPFYYKPFFFDKGGNASQTAKIVNIVYSADTVKADYVQFWFRRFRSGIFYVKNASRTGRPVIENVDKTTKIIEIDRHVSSRSIVQELKIDHKTVLNHLRKVGLKKSSMFGCTPKNMMDRISTCKALAKRNEIDPFLKRMVAGDVKWVTYDNLYCQQLDRLKLAINQKWLELVNRRCTVFHQDNVRPHTSVVTLQKLWKLDWEVLMHPPYSPGLTPSDYHLFLALQNFLSDKKLGSREDCENLLPEFFANKDQDFYERGITKVPLKWPQVIQ
ncbi:histone-lysine N-methyltransferase SETMAR [Trichonephila clavipes]|nr:histone-lysine N-methyltransferase SETMAR [Trichonephila clavipes]